MGFLENIKNIFHIKNKETISLGDANIREWFGLSEVKAEAMSEATYFTCLKMLSETLGKMSIKFYQDTERGIVNAESNRVCEYSRIVYYDLYTLTWHNPQRFYPLLCSILFLY